MVNKAHTATPHRGLEAMGIDGKLKRENQGWSRVREWVKAGLSRRKLEMEHSWERRTRTWSYPQNQEGSILRSLWERQSCERRFGVPSQ